MSLRCPTRTGDPGVALPDLPAGGRERTWRQRRLHPHPSHPFLARRPEGGGSQTDIQLLVEVVYFGVAPGGGLEVGVGLPGGSEEDPPDGLRPW